MSWFSSLFSSSAAQPIEAVGNVLDGLFTSDEEKLDKQIIMRRLAQKPSLAQVELNKIEASHRSVFVAGWRPFIGWICGISLGVYFIPQFALASYMWVTICLDKGELVAYPATGDSLFELVLAMLGMGALRTFEKMNGKAK